jgi:hypothetical protein
MTLAELIALIAEHDDCNRSTAWKQICDALSDRKLHIKWEKEPLRLSPYIVYVHRPPEGASFWQQADVDDNGKVFDLETDNRRTLLILRDDVFKNDVFQLWPKPSAATARLGGPHSTWNEVEQTYYRLLREDPRVKDTAPTEVAKSIAKKCGKKHDDRGWSMRRLLEHIQRIRAEH